MKHNKRKSILCLSLLACGALVLPITSVNANTNQNSGAIKISILSSLLESTPIQKQDIVDTNISIQEEVVKVNTKTVEEPTTIVETPIAPTPVVNNPMCPNNPNCDGINHTTDCNNYANHPNNPNCNGINHDTNCNNNGNNHNKGQHNQSGIGHQKGKHHN